MVESMMKAQEHLWVREFPAELSICDREGVLLEMNRAAEALFAGEGGRTLIGSNILNCHPEPDCRKLKRLLETGQTNVYLSETKGCKTFVFQAPWYLEGRYAGLVEVSFEVPDDIPHFIRE